MGGGGKNTVTQSSGVPDYLKGDVQKAFGAATKAHESGQLGGVAAVTPEQQRAETIQNELANDAILGRGAYDIESQLARDLKNAQGQQLATQAGNSTSARQDRANASALADRSLQHALTRQQAQSQGTQALRDLGQTAQAREQAQADSAHTGLQRLFGYYGSGAAGTQQKQSGGGGK